MIDFISREAFRLAPYTPGEQPQNQEYLKLNTNESPFPPSEKVIRAVMEEQVQRLNLYSDPSCKNLHMALAERYKVKPENVISGNGSDEILAFAFRAFCGEGKPVAYADITYGFYKAQTALFGLEAHIIPLREDFTMDMDKYLDFPGMLVIANPNAPTGISLPREEIERLLRANPQRVILVDEAYVDFGGESCVPLIHKYENLLVVQTMSKSRQLAGARLGYALGSVPLIEAMNRVKYSFNPYNVNRMTMAAGIAAVEDEVYFKKCCYTIVENRRWTTAELEKLGFSVLPSKANFVFAKSDKISGEELYQRLKERGVLVRWFPEERIFDYLRITIGSKKQMQALIFEISCILQQEGGI